MAALSGSLGMLVIVVAYGGTTADPVEGMEAVRQQVREGSLGGVVLGRQAWADGHFASIPGPGGVDDVDNPLVAASLTPIGKRRGGTGGVSDSITAAAAAGRDASAAGALDDGATVDDGGGRGGPRASGLVHATTQEADGASEEEQLKEFRIVGTPFRGQFAYEPFVTSEIVTRWCETIFKLERRSSAVVSGLLYLFRTFLGLIGYLLWNLEWTFHTYMHAGLLGRGSVGDIFSTIFGNLMFYTWKGYVKNMYYTMIAFVIVFKVYQKHVFVQATYPSQ